jgi:hypothetical protein
MRLGVYQTRTGKTRARTGKTQEAGVEEEEEQPLREGEGVGGGDGVIKALVSC